jgi:hypothetical protein
MFLSIWSSSDISKLMLGTSVNIYIFQNFTRFYITKTAKKRVRALQHYKRTTHEGKKEGPEIGASSMNWAQLSRFCLKTETESSLRNAVF